MIQSAVFRKYTYDAIYQLLTVSRTGSSTLNLIFTYDGVGNRLTQNKDGAVTNYAYNDGNQMISSTYLAWGGVTQYFYFDNNGNNTGNAIPNFGSVCQIAYDYENRGISFTANWGVATTYTYDAFSRMTSRTLNGVTAKYMYDGQSTVADYNGSNACQASYVTPFLDCNLLVSRTGTTYYYMQDGLGSVRNIVNSAQTVVNTYDYNAYGEDVSQTQGVTNRFKFAGREYCAEEQGYNNRARMYVPMMGRFLQRDPIGYAGGTNIYSYCYNNPVNWIDPSGLYAVAGQDNTTAWAGPARPGMKASVSARPANPGDELQVMLLAFILGIHSNRDINDPITINDVRHGRYGHAWISFYNTDNGIVTTFGLWPDGRTKKPEKDEKGQITGGRIFQNSDVVVNHEGGYVPLYSRYYVLTPEQVIKFMEYISRPATYSKPTNTCASWASDCVWAVVGEDVDADDEVLGGLETPIEVSRSIDELEKKHPTRPLGPNIYRQKDGHSPEGGSSFK